MGKVEEKFDVFLEYEDKLIVSEEDAFSVVDVIHRMLTESIYWRDTKFIHAIEVERKQGCFV